MIQLSDHFGYRRLLRFSFSSVIMLVFSSIYGVVDGFFVSNFVGKTSFTAVNFIIPYLIILGSFGFMFGTGGSALIAKTLGEGNGKKARSIFTLIICASIACGIALAAIGIATIRPVAEFLGAEGQLLEDSVSYGRMILIALPAYILQYEFQCLFVTAEKPHLGLGVTVLAGITNIALDAILVAVCDMGLTGAAVATVIGQCIGGFLPILYFLLPNSSCLRFTKPEWDIRAIGKTCQNGSSELMSNISMSIVSILYNAQLLKYAGEDGVAAYGVLMYVNMIFQAIFIGYSVGTAPIVGYHFGMKNYGELRNLRKKSLKIIDISSLAMFAFAELLAHPLSGIFVRYDADLLTMTTHAFRIFSISFLLSGFSIFGSSFFTALNNGGISAAISFLRTLVFQAAAVLILPIFWQLDGIWISIVVAEFVSMSVTILFLILKRKKYHY